MRGLVTEVMSLDMDPVCPKRRGWNQVHYYYVTCMYGMGRGGEIEERDRMV